MVRSRLRMELSSNDEPDVESRDTSGSVCGATQTRTSPAPPSGSPGRSAPRETPPAAARAARPAWRRPCLTKPQKRLARDRPERCENQRTPARSTVANQSRCAGNPLHGNELVIRADAVRQTKPGARRRARAGGRGVRQPFIAADPLGEQPQRPQSPIRRKQVLGMPVLDVGAHSGGLPHGVEAPRRVLALLCTIVIVGTARAAANGPTGPSARVELGPPRKLPTLNKKKVCQRGARGGSGVARPGESKSDHEPGGTAPFAALDVERLGRRVCEHAAPRRRTGAPHARRHLHDARIATERAAVI